MTVIPVINCLDFECARERVRTAEKFFPFGGGWVHLDITDGKFTYNKTWGDSDEWRKLQTNLNLEVHLMVEEPELVLEKWLRVGAKRVIVHLETMKDEDFILELAKAFDAEVMLAITPETPVEALRVYFEKFKAFQILAVNPGLSGQKFLPYMLDKVRFLRELYPGAKIEVDGGINLETGKKCADAGAHILASGAYIFGSKNPAEAYNTLASLG